MFCPHCGAKLPDGAAFCGYCGKPLPTRSQPTSGPASVPGPEPVPASASAPTPNPVPGQPVTGAASTQQAPWVDQKPAKKPFYVTRGMTIGILVAAVAVVVLIVLGVTGVFGGGSQNTAEGVASRVETLYADLLQSDFDEEAFTDFGEGLIDMLPPQMVEDALAQEGYTRDAFAEEFGSELGGAIGSYGTALSSYLDAFSISVDITLGDQLDSDQLESMSSAFSSEGYDYTVTDAYSLNGEVTITMKEDFSGYSAGDTVTQDMGSTGLCAVEIDGTWYLWGGSY